MREGQSIVNFRVNSGFAVDKIHELNSFEAAINLASRGFGIVAIPGRNARVAVELGVLRRINIKGIDPKDFGSYTICATYLKSEIEANTRDLCLQQLRKSLQSGS